MKHNFFAGKIRNNVDIKGIESTMDKLDEVGNNFPISVSQIAEGINYYSHTLKTNKIFQSMSRKGNCYDNSVMKSFFGILKQEMYYGKVFYSFDELKNAIVKYIEYYNKQRIKQKLGWLSPINYKLNLLAA